jgi:hypothetical protein
VEDLDTDYQIRFFQQWNNSHGMLSHTDDGLPRGTSSEEEDTHGDGGVEPPNLLTDPYTSDQDNPISTVYGVSFSSNELTGSPGGCCLLRRNKARTTE